MSFTSCFCFEFNYKDWLILLKVDYRFTKGTTSQRGDNPDSVEILSAIDGTGKDVWPRLDALTREAIETQAIEDGALLALV